MTETWRGNAAALAETGFRGVQFAGCGPVENSVAFWDHSKKLSAAASRWPRLTAAVHFYMVASSISAGPALRAALGIEMKKLTFCVAILAGALVMMAQSARAQEGFRLFRGDPELIIPSIGVGLATTGAYFAVRNAGGGGHRITQLGAWGLTTVGCMALTPIISGIVVQRELTRREAHVMIADCIVPFIGGWIMHAYFDAHPERDSVPPPRAIKVARKHR